MDFKPGDDDLVRQTVVDYVGADDVRRAAAQFIANCKLETGDTE